MGTDDANQSLATSSTPLSRRRLLEGAAAGGLGLYGAGLVDARLLDAALAAVDQRPKRGGRLRVGLVGAGKDESLNPARATSNVIGLVRTFNLYDRLVRYVPDLSRLAPGLAVEWTPNDDFTVWQFKLRPDVVWHDGKAFTADDVVYSLRRAGRPDNADNRSVANVRLDGVRKVNKLTVKVPLKQSDTLFPYLLGAAGASIIAKGATDFTKPVGTGGFMFDSFRPGERSLFSKNPNYWDDNKPYVDELEIISIDDDTARLNALRSGQIDVLGNLPFALAKTVSRSGQFKLIDTPGLTPYLFYMRVDSKPFDDVRVRKAMKLIVDRQAMIDVALSGFGGVANDLVGKGLPFYAKSLPQRKQDIEQARFLLKQAGYDRLQVTLTTSAIGAGLVEAGTLFAEQAKAAGVTVKLKNVPANAFFDSSLQYLKIPFASSYWLVSNLSNFYLGALTTKAPYNETHWRKPSFDKLLREAMSATDEAVAREKWFQVQKLQYEQGGYLVWANVNNTDAAARRVRGITPSRAYPLGMPTGFINAWLA